MPTLSLTGGEPLRPVVVVTTAPRHRAYGFAREPTSLYFTSLRCNGVFMMNVGCLADRHSVGARDE